MWKLLSGIFLVVLLDVAFIWMMTAKPETFEIARSIGPTAAVPAVRAQPRSEPLAIDDSPEPVLDESYEAREIRGARSNRRGSGSSERVAQPDTGTVAVAASADTFKDTIIWIGRTEVPVKIGREEVSVATESKVDDAIHASISEAPPSSNGTEKKKRSFQAKAIGVIRKPLDWVKAVADRLH